MPVRAEAHLRVELQLGASSGSRFAGSPGGHTPTWTVTAPLVVNLNALPGPDAPCSNPCQNTVATSGRAPMQRDLPTRLLTTCCRRVSSSRSIRGTLSSTARWYATPLAAAVAANVSVTLRRAARTSTGCATQCGSRWAARSTLILGPAPTPYDGPFFFRALHWPASRPTLTPWTKRTERGSRTYAQLKREHSRVHARQVENVVHERQQSLAAGVDDRELILEVA